MSRPPRPCPAGPLIALVFLAGCATVHPANAPAPANAGDSVVKLHAIFLDAARVRQGSAIIVDASGLLIAPRQLTDGADVIDVDLPRPGQPHVTAEVIYDDPAHDLVVLLVDATGLPPAEFDTATIKPGSATVIAAGWTATGALSKDEDGTPHLRLDPRDGELGATVTVAGRPVAIVVAREADSLTLADAPAITRLRDRAIEDANVGRATPFSPGTLGR